MYFILDRQADNYEYQIAGKRRIKMKNNADTVVIKNGSLKARKV